MDQQEQADSNILTTAASGQIATMADNREAVRADSGEAASGQITTMADSGEAAKAAFWSTASDSKLKDIDLEFKVPEISGKNAPVAASSKTAPIAASGKTTPIVASGKTAPGAFRPSTFAYLRDSEEPTGGQALSFGLPRAAVVTSNEKDSLSPAGQWPLSLSWLADGQNVLFGGQEAFGDKGPFEGQGPFGGEAWPMSEHGGQGGRFGGQGFISGDVGSLGGHKYLSGQRLPLGQGLQSGKKSVDEEWPPAVGKESPRREQDPDGGSRPLSGKTLPKQPAVPLPEPTSAPLVSTTTTASVDERSNTLSDKYSSEEQNPPPTAETEIVERQQQQQNPALATDWPSPTPRQPIRKKEFFSRGVGGQKGQGMSGQLAVTERPRRPETPPTRRGLAKKGSKGIGEGGGGGGGREGGGREGEGGRGSKLASPEVTPDNMIKRLEDRRSPIPVVKKVNILQSTYINE